ncbi:MAG TPA: 4-(cytidine 5'-diphospho)-2-C-methyl-D-erythritol kinase [Lachnospiraceae bacterium]
MRLRAYAKINLGLDVIGKREDGYHEVKMVMQTIGMYDQIYIEKIEENEIRLRTNVPYIPCDEHNLIYQAAALMKREYKISGGFDIELKKVIPVAAGLAGGSADAAATLVGINSIFRLGLDKQALMRLAIKLGADVPYCVMRGTALAEGIGEILSPLSPMPKSHILVAKPAINVSTRTVYEDLDAQSITSHPDIDALIEGLDSRQLHNLIPHMGNVLEEVTANKYPIIRELKERMKELGAVVSMMSGSGPTVFGIFEDENLAKIAKEILRKEEKAKQVFLTVPFNTRR